MTKYADKSNEELASAFIVSTCQLLPKSSPVVSDHMHDLMASSELYANRLFNFLWQRYGVLYPTAEYMH